LTVLLVIVALLVSLALLRLVSGLRSRRLEVVREEPEWPSTIFTSTARRKGER